MNKLRMERLLLLLIGAALTFQIFAGCVGNRTTPSQAWSGLSIEGDIGYVGTPKGQILALDLTRQGMVIASFEVADAGRTDAFPGFYSSPLVFNDTVYAGGFDGVVYALDAQTLTQEISFEIEGDRLAKSIVGELAISDDRIVFGAAETAESGRLYVLDLDLRERCVFPSRGANPIGAIWGGPRISEGIAYFGDLDHNLYAVDIENCNPVWDSPIELDGAIVAKPLLINNYLYIGTFGQSFYSVDILSGSKAVILNADNWFWANPYSDGQKIYIPSLDGRLYAVDQQSKALAWKYPTGDVVSPIVSTPVNEVGIVALGSDDGNLVLLDPETGQRLWDQRIGEKIRAPLVSNQGIVYVHSTDKKLHAYDLNTRRLSWIRDLESGY